MNSSARSHAVSLSPRKVKSLSRHHLVVDEVDRQDFRPLKERAFLVHAAHHQELRSGLFRRAFKLIEGRSANFARLRTADRRDDSIGARAFEVLSQPGGERLQPLLVLGRHVLGFARRVGVGEIENRHADLVSLRRWRA